MEHTSKKKTSLGRGLGSLFGEEADAEEGPRIRLIPVANIHPNPHQPRKYFANDALDELIASIREQGVLQPVLVRSMVSAGVEGAYELVAGERRWRASVAAGLSEIPCIVKELTDQEVVEISLLENIQREDLNPVEIARALQRLMEEFEYTHKKIAERIGKNRITITNYLRILKLPDQVLTMIIQGGLTLGHAKALLTMGEDNPALLTLADRVVAEQLSVREAERLSQEWMARQEEEQPHVVRANQNGGRRKDPSILDMERGLCGVLGTRVTITHLHGKGRVVLEYGTLDELEKIASRLGMGGVAHSEE